MKKSFWKKTASLTLVASLALSSMFAFGGTQAFANGNADGDTKTNNGVKFNYSDIQTYDVTFKKRGKSEGKKIAKAFGAEIVGEYMFSTDTVTIRIGKEGIEKLAKHPHVIMIEADELVEPEGVEFKMEEENLEPQAYYSGTFDSRAWTIDSHNAKQAYSRGYSGQNVNVAILDSGVDKNHPMLKHAIKGGASVVTWTKDYQDHTGHGTAVAGGIASKLNGKPYGIAPDVNLYPVVITNSATDGKATTSSMTRGLEWAIAERMDVVNISFARGTRMTSFERAADIAKKAGIAVFNAGGNDGVNVDAVSSRCDYDSVYCISAIDKDNNIVESYWSSAYGSTKIEAGAGGSGVPSTTLGTTAPTVKDGTSLATPVFAGIYALHKSEHLSASVDQIMGHMRNSYVKINTTKPIGGGKAWYTPWKPSSSEVVLGSWNYYYKGSTNTLSVNAYDANNSSSMVREVRYELWTFDPFGINFVENVGIKKGPIYSDDLVINRNMTLDPNKRYLVKAIVDFSNGERHWEYLAVKGLWN